MMRARTPETRSGRTEAVCLLDWHPKAYVYAGRPMPKYASMRQGLFGNPFAAKSKAQGVEFEKFDSRRNPQGGIAGSRGAEPIGESERSD